MTLRHRGVRVGFALLSAALAVLVVTAQAGAVDTHAVTWEELRSVQATERAELLKVQSDQVRALLETQQKTIEALVERNVGSEELANLAAKQSDERLEITKRHSQEREEIAKTHAQERVSFMKWLYDEKKGAEGASIKGVSRFARHREVIASRIR